MELGFKNFQDLLKENLDDYIGEYEKFIDYGPDLFKLLTELLNDERVKSEERLKINAAIAYFVVPYDIIPEQIYGPYGYIDDIFLSCHVIKGIADIHGYDYINNLWECEEDIKDVVELCYARSKKVMDKNEIESILIYSGLKD